MYFTKREIDYNIWNIGNNKKALARRGMQYMLLKKFNTLKKFSKNKDIAINGYNEVNFTKSELCYMLKIFEKYLNDFSGDLGYLTPDEQNHVTYVLGIASSMVKKLRPVVAKFENDENSNRLES